MPPTPSSPTLPAFLNGVDLSYLAEAEANGAEFSASGGGAAEDALRIVARNGANVVRLRVWNDPPWPNQTYANWTNVLQLAKRVHAAGMAIHLDFHYSDWWADPSQQHKPRAWAALPFDQLVQQAHEFTRIVVEAAVAQGTPPAIVQTGNEITNGMLWAAPGEQCSAGAGTWRPANDCGDPDSASNPQSNWPRFVRALNQTIRAVRDASPATKVMVHVSEWGKADWWLDQAAALGLQKFDMLGVSFYEQFHSETSGGPVNTIACNCSWCLRRVQEKHPGIPIVFVETAYPFEASPRNIDWTPDYDFTPAGQANYLRALTGLANETFGAASMSGGSGVYWWCAECIDAYWKSYAGTSYYRETLFGHDGAALPAQQVWRGGADACAAAIEAACPSLRGARDMCVDCVESRRPRLQSVCGVDEMTGWCAAPDFCNQQAQ